MEAPEVYSATGIDDALDLLEVVNAKKDKASVGQQAAGLERHPEVRVLVPADCAWLIFCRMDSVASKYVTI